MSQSTLDDDELFTEAASEMREDVEESLAAARDELPAADDIWTVEADNTLGVLNSLSTALTLGDARENLRDAKKWYTMGTEADAFDDAEDLAEEIQAVEDLLGDIEAAKDHASELASTIPQLKSALEETTEDETEAAEA